MEIKYFELRDRCTTIGVCAIKTARVEQKEKKILDYYGYDDSTVMIIKLENGDANYDAYAWNNSRTMTSAHNYIQQHFDKLENYSVVDVEYILGEKAEPKDSEIWRGDAISEELELRQENKYSKLQEFCKFLDPEWRYAVKDKYSDESCVYFSSEKPLKEANGYCMNGDVMGMPEGVKQEIFDCLSWDDEQPYDIEKGGLADE